MSYSKQVENKIGKNIWGNYKNCPILLEKKIVTFIFRTNSETTTPYSHC